MIFDVLFLLKKTYFRTQKLLLSAIYSCTSTLQWTVYQCTPSIVNIFIFLWSTESKQIVFDCSSNVGRINQCCSQRLGYTSTLTFLLLPYASFGIRIQMWIRLKVYWYCGFVIRDLRNKKRYHPHLPHSTPSEVEGVRIDIISFRNIAKNYY